MHKKGTPLMRELDAFVEARLTTLEASGALAALCGLKASMRPASAESFDDFTLTISCRQEGRGSVSSKTSLPLLDALDPESVWMKVGQDLATLEALASNAKPSPAATALAENAALSDAAAPAKASRPGIGRL